MKNRILLTVALCMSMMAQITAQGYTSLREQIQLAGEWESSLGTCRLPGTLHHQKQFLTPETLRDIYFTGINHFTTIRIETC